MKRRLLIGLLGLAAAGPAVAQPPPPNAPPPPRYEPVPAPPGTAYIWQPGHWHWNGVQYVWLPGRYVVRAVGYHRWVPGRWVWGPAVGRWVWRPAHWE